MSLANRQYNEKRNFLRMQIDSHVAVSLQSGNEEVIGMCLDLSGGGMLIETNRVLPMGAQVDITIMPPKGTTPMMTAKAEVIRVDSRPDETCILGLEIIKVLPN
jgi:hypothetical protein